MRRLRFLLAAALLPAFAAAQMDPGASMGGMKHETAAPSTALTITGLHGETKVIQPAELKAMPHESVTVTNGRTHQQETYSGVPVKTLLALVEPTNSTAGDAMQARRSTRMTVIVAEGTDKFRVAVSFCDVDPACRSGQAIVADSMNGQPLTTDGAFKLILSEDKMPARWVRNLDALVETNLATM